MVLFIKLNYNYVIIFKKYKVKMRSIPIDVVNYICEFASGKNKLWYPCFSPKTGKVSWKVNPYCIKYLKYSKKLLNPLIHVNLTFYNVKTREDREILCRMIILDFHNDVYDKIYIEFNLDDDKSEKFMTRGMLSVLNHDVRPHDIIYLNGTPYAEVHFGWAPNRFSYSNQKRLTIGYETY